MRDAIQRAFASRSTGLWTLWFAAPLLCTALPGLGVLLAGIWIALCMWAGRQPAGVIGLRIPRRAARLFVFAVGLAAIFYGMAEYVIDPLAARLTGEEPDLSKFAEFEGNWKIFLGFLALAWIGGALLEEVVFRGFLLQYGVRLLGETALWPLAVFSSMVFGYSHLYQGPAGMLSTGVIGFMIAAVFILSKRNLLLVMLVHGLLDTIYFTLAFTGIKPLA